MPAERCGGEDTGLLPGRLLRRPGPPQRMPSRPGVQVDDPRLAAVLAPGTPLLCLHQGTLHGEGPAWDAPRNRLVWSDVSNRRLLAWFPDDGRVEVVVDATQFMNGNALGADNHLLHCEHGRRCISRSGEDGVPVPVVTHHEGRRLNSPNDIAVAPDGTAWFTDPTFGLLVPSQGSIAAPELDHRSVYRLDPRDGSLRRMADFEQPNGLCFSRDGRTLYVSDTSLSLNDVPGQPGEPQPAGTLHEVVAFDVAEDGRLSRRRFFCHADHGVPDGLAVDRRGWLWVTADDGVHVWAPDRTRLGFVPTPETASNCAFGGPGMTRLFITATSRLLALDLLS